jgi:hypothetical protein
VELPSATLSFSSDVTNFSLLRRKNIAALGGQAIVIDQHFQDPQGVPVAQALRWQPMERGSMPSTSRGTAAVIENTCLLMVLFDAAFEDAF